MLRLYALLWWSYALRLCFFVVVVEFELFEGQKWDVEAPELKKAARGLLGCRYVDGNADLKLDLRKMQFKIVQEVTRKYGRNRRILREKTDLHST